MEMLFFSGGRSAGLTSSARLSVCLQFLVVVSLCLFISTLPLDTLLQRQMEPDAQLTLGEEFFIFKQVKGKNHLEAPLPLAGHLPSLNPGLL